MSEEKQDLAPNFPSIPINSVNEGEGLKIFKCPNCGQAHFRHAGYIEVPTPFVEADRGSEVKAVLSSQPVKICVNCKFSFITYNSRVYNITHLIDLKAWDKMEKEAQEATGPGGEC